MKWIVRDDVKEDDKLRAGFFELAVETFGLDFRPWYEGGFWGDKYIPHAVEENGKVIANVSVNLMDFKGQGEPKRFLQLGTVMTDKECRGQGLSRFLMEEVLATWKNRCDGIYLYANDAVLGFYPRFGFAPMEEHTCRTVLTGCGCQARLLDMGKRADAALLLGCYAHGNPYAEISMADNPGLLMFYCAGLLRNDVYYLSELDVATVVSQEGQTLFCHDVFGEKRAGLLELLRMLCDGKTDVELGFTPSDKDGFQMDVLKEEDTTMFVLQGMDDPLAGRQAMLPSLSHA